MTKPRTSLPGWAEPLYATERTGRPVYGADGGLPNPLVRMGVELGTPLMAWQEYVSDVALEIDPDTGRLAYREVVVSVMRQNGKTTLVLAAECARCLLWGSPQRVAYTAQTGIAARKKFKEDHRPMIERTLGPLVQRFYMSDGNTSMVWKNASRINVLDASPEAGHGMTLDLAVIDEAFADKNNDREQALLPTMATRPNSQIWNVSTAGTESSMYLKRKVELGRAAVSAGSTSGLAYFEFGIDDTEDIDDPDVHAKRMPAYNVTISPEYIAHARQTMTEGDFRRAIGNQWTATEERIIPGEYWRQVSKPGVKVDATHYAIDATPDRAQAVVVKAAPGRVQLVAVRSGVDWLVDAFEGEEKRLPIVVDRNGPAAGKADQLEDAGFQIVRYDSLQVRKACGDFYDHIIDRKVQVAADERLDTAVEHAAQKSTADAWAWNRDARGGEMLTALSLCLAEANKGDWTAVSEWV